VVRVALLWHMHQPSYRDPFDGAYVLPWVRLHALKDYWGMVELLQPWPEMHVTFNMVPSLVDQVEQYARGEARETLLELSLKPAASLTLEDRLLALQGFFTAHEQNLIGRFPRFVELHELRGKSKEDLALRSAAARFGMQDWLDLQVLSKLAWMDLEWQRRDAGTAALVSKGRGFSEEDKQRLAERERALLQAILPAYRSAAERGQVELSTSPYYHPILPLLCDSEAHHEGTPGAALPRRFRHPEDAADQIRRALARHAEVFGSPPAGMWPSEGSVSEEAVLEMARLGVRWTASDEGVLERSANRPIHRDSRGTAYPLDLLYRPWLRQTEAGPIHVLFRDRALSDLIGFSYSSMEPNTAARDLLERLRRIGESWMRQGLGGEPTVPIILDGENAWEYFRDGGRVFLSTLYEGIAADPELVGVTVSEALAAAPAGELPRVFAGSWINANFGVWIGHADDRRAWDLLSDARDALADSSSSASPEQTQRAWEIYRAACGSDWCWWYGEEHASQNDVEFDRLYRRHLQAIYATLGRTIPATLGEPLITTRKLEVRQSRPTGSVFPEIDGLFTTPGEWVPAGVFRVSVTGGAMHRGADIVRAVRFGIGGESLHVAVETAGPARKVLATSEIHLSFPGPTTWRYRIAGGGAGDDGQLIVQREEWTDLGWIAARSTCVAAARAVLECSVPLAELRPGHDREIAFRVVLVEAGVEVARYPEVAPLRIVPEEVTRD
jgi:alpha-amylase/alpha-mannosidase (GH57 family)